MHIILSRKGFDSQYGGQPSSILPDGTLLSLPIPSKEDKLKFSNLNYDSKSYLDIIRELKPNTKINNNYTCHLDPDLRSDTLKRNDNWLPLFGQKGSSQGHLSNKGITIGDLFLFFGTFRATELHNAKLRYISGAPEVHLIYGYLQVGSMYSEFKSINHEIKYHPHAQDRYANEKNNCIYKARECLSFNENLRGANNLFFHEDLVLTKTGHSKSKWDMPSFFKDIDISYHSARSFTPDYFQSAAKGQEFVIESNNKVQEWGINIIEKGTFLNN
jgi:hypothetical protein